MCRHLLQLNCMPRSVSANVSVAVCVTQLKCPACYPPPPLPSQRTRPPCLPTINNFALTRRTHTLMQPVLTLQLHRCILLLFLPLHLLLMLLHPQSSTPLPCTISTKPLQLQTTCHRQSLPPHTRPFCWLQHKRQLQSAPLVAFTASLFPTHHHRRHHHRHHHRSRQRIRNYFSTKASARHRCSTRTQ